MPSLVHIGGIADLPYRDLYTEPPTPDVRVSRLCKGGVRMMLLTNEGNADVDAVAAIDGALGLVAVDLWRGEHWREEVALRDGKTAFRLDLAPRESRLYILDDGSFPSPPRAKRRYVDVDFSLISEDTGAYVKTYRGSLSVGGDTADVWLRVDAEEMVECFVNGRFVDASLWKRHEFLLSAHLVPGENDVLLKVTGNAANRYTAHTVAYGLM